MTNAEEIAAVRRFSRFYTSHIGVLEDSLLGSGLSLPQARLVYEIANASGEAPTPGQLASRLGLDAGYVSRLVGGLEAQGLLEKSASDSDGRSTVLRLREAGRRAYCDIDARSAREVGQLLATLGAGARARIVAAMQQIERDLDGTGRPQPAIIREPRPGDIGFVVSRHGAIYADEYGWDWTFEAAVARIAADYIDGFDAARDCCRIAEAGGRIVGSSFVVKTDKPGVAKLRLVYVEREMRGTGLGRALVEDCMAFARHQGYRRMTLWTNDVLVPARRLYQRLGFEMTAAEPTHAFGHAMVSETWERDL